jgi:DnaA family protein
VIVQQLPLGFTLRDDATFDNFIADENTQLVQSIFDIIQAKGDNFLYIWGAEGCGRSHLLQATCHAAPESNQTAFYLPLDQIASFSPEILQGLENISVVCLDDIEQVAGNQVWEEALFHLFNRIRANGNHLIVAADTPPTQLKINLPDLKSRLTWGIVYQLHALNDEHKLAALQLRAQGRGLDLDQPVGKFLLRRCPRNMAQLFQTLEQLDQASMVQQRRLTIPFVKEVLGV